MWVTWIIVVLLLAAATGGVALTFLRTRGAMSPLIRWLVALAPLSAAVLIYVVLSIIAAAPNHDWNGAKIAPAIGMLKGYPLYPDPRTGAMTAWIYGPVPALLMLPAALWSRPTWVIVVGVIINYLVCMLPTLWLHCGAMSRPNTRDKRLVPDRRGWRWFAAMSFVGFAWLTLDHESLRRAVLMINPDGPTLGMLSASLALLAMSRTAESRANRKRQLIVTALSAACAVLACWCKQSAVPALLAAPIYLLIAEGWIAAITYAACLAVSGAVISGVLLFSFGASNMWFHMVTLSAHHPWRDLERGRFTLLFEAILLLSDELVPTLMLLAIVLAGRHYFFTSQRVPMRRWFADNVWITLPIMAVLLIPAALLGYLKIGGYVNNFSLVHWFTGAAATVYLVRIFRESDDTADSSTLRRTFALAAASLLLLVHTPTMLLTKRKPESMFIQIASVKSNAQETVYDFAKQRPGFIYFPWNVLSMLLAEGKYYHFEWGIYDRLASPPAEGLRPSGAQIVAHLPEKMEYVGFGPLTQSRNTMYVLPAPPNALAATALPGFVLYPERRPPPDVAEMLAKDIRLFDDGKKNLDSAR